MQTTPLILADTRIRQDAAGRYCLNDLHRAAVAAGANARTKEPGKFLSSPRTQELLRLLEQESATQNLGGGPTQILGTPLAQSVTPNWGNAPSNSVTQILGNGIAPIHTIQAGDPRLQGFDFVMHEAGLTSDTPGYARAMCLMYLSEGLDTSICDPQTYVDEDCPDVRQVDFLPDDLIEDAASARLVALRMLRYAHASGFFQVAKLAQAAAVNNARRMVKLADEMFATVPAQEMLAYGLGEGSGLQEAAQ